LFQILFEKTHIDDKKLNLKLYKKFKIKELGSSISYIKVLSNDLKAIGYKNGYVEFLILIK
jgi:hypothetical protein